MGNNLLETADPGPEPRKLSRAKVETAARSLGFREVKYFTMPDGERIWWWWHSRPDLTQTRT
jgi:hypothetical protein